MDGRTEGIPTGFQRRLPNALTIARVVMTVVFVGVLGVYSFEPSYTISAGAMLLVIAAGLFVVASLTDALDGHLARKWNAISVFGRIADPLADKVLVLGALIMMAGSNFGVDYTSIGTDRDGHLVELHYQGQITGVASWMVVVILARELLVTTLRGSLEGRGIDFSASMSGKLKMIVQSLGVPIVLVLACLIDHALGQVQLGVDSSGIEAARDSLRSANGWSRFAVAIAWMITLVTAVSAVPYITRAMRAMRPAGGTDG